MTTTPTQDPARGRTLRRRHLLQRQTIVFGTLLVIVTAFGLAALGVFLGVLPAPFDSEFTDLKAEEEASLFTPCPPAGALPVGYDQITTNVYNGTETAGLAGGASQSLAAAGVVIGTTANYAGGLYPGATLIITGNEGIASAYTVAALLPGAEIQFDAARTDAVIDVVLGDQFTAVGDPATSTLDPSVPLVGLEGCAVPADVLTSTDSA